jgi:site-specific recombinase XerD
MEYEIGRIKLEYAFFGVGGYLDRCQKSSGYPRVSIKAKRRDLVLLLDFVMKTNPKPCLNALTAEVLLAWIAQMSLNYSPASIARSMATLKHFLKVTQEEFGLPCPLRKWPSVTVTPPKIPRINDQKLKQIREELDGKDYRSLLERAMLETVLHSGLRASELISLKTSQMKGETMNIYRHGDLLIKPAKKKGGAR